MPRIHLPHIPISGIVELDERAAQHVRVLRLRIGDAVQFFDGMGGVAEANVIHCDKKRVALQLGERSRAVIPALYPTHLIQSLIRNDNMDWVIQKAVELGVASITPLIGERVQGRLQGAALAKKMAHWQEIIVSAAEQCGQNILPTLHPLIHFEALSQHADRLGAELMILDPEASHSFRNLGRRPNASALLIGPEGGFSPTEMQLILQKKWTRIALHPNILRAETAAIVSIAMCQFCFIIP